MNANAIVTATSLVAATTLFAVFYAVENSSVDVGDSYYGSITDKTIGDVKFSRFGNERSLYYVDPETQRTVLLNNDVRIEWDAEGNLINCDSDSTVMEETEGMFPGNLGGDATVGATPAAFIPSVPVAECSNMAKKEIMESGTHKKSMAELARALEEEDVSELSEEEAAEHRKNVAFANLALLAYEEPDNERMLHAFGYHMNEVYGSFGFKGVLFTPPYIGWATGALHIGMAGGMGDQDSVHNKSLPRYSAVGTATGHQISTYKPRFFHNYNAQASSYRCIFTIRGSDDLADWHDDGTAAASVMEDRAGKRVIVCHQGYNLYTYKLTEASEYHIMNADNLHSQQKYNVKRGVYVQTHNHPGFEMPGTKLTTGWRSSDFDDGVQFCRTRLGDQRDFNKLAGLYSTGHSLGGAAAILLHHFYFKEIEPITYASPSVKHNFRDTTWRCLLTLKPRVKDQFTMSAWGKRLFHFKDPVSLNVIVPHFNPAKWEAYKHHTWGDKARHFGNRGKDLIFIDSISGGTGSVKKYLLNNSDLRSQYRYVCHTFDKDASTINDWMTNGTNYWWDCRNHKNTSEDMQLTSSLSDMNHTQVDLEQFETLSWMKNTTLSASTPLNNYQHMGVNKFGQNNTVTSSAKQVAARTTQHSEWKPHDEKIINGLAYQQGDNAFGNTCWASRSNNVSIGRGVTRASEFSNYNSNFEQDLAANSAASQRTIQDFNHMMTGCTYLKRLNIALGLREVGICGSAYTNSSQLAAVSNVRSAGAFRPGKKAAWIGEHSAKNLGHDYFYGSSIHGRYNWYGNTPTSSEYNSLLIVPRKFRDFCAMEKVNGSVGPSGTRVMTSVDAKKFEGSKLSGCFDCHNSDEIYGLQMSGNVQNDHLYWDSFFSGRQSGTPFSVGDDHDDDDVMPWGWGDNPASDWGEGGSYQKGSNKGGNDDWCRFRHC